MEKYLKDTYGVTVYQEQVMLLSRLLANFTRGESDQLRKAMGKKIMALLAELKPKFINGGKSNGHDEKTLEKIWADWEKFASYAFNKSHAACYSWVAYQTAYLKAHYPAEFMAANPTVAKDDIKDVTKFMDECKAMKISVLAPDVNESEMNFTVNSKGDIRFGLGGIKGVGEAAVEAILNERAQNGKFKSLFDFLERVNLQTCNRKTVENLALAGAFDCFTDIYREQLFDVNVKGENVLETLMRYGNKFQQDKNQQQYSLFGDLGGDMGIEIQHPELPKASKWSTIERLNKEKTLIGIFLSAHPLDEWAFEINEMCNITAADLNFFESWKRPDARKAYIAPTETETDETNTLPHIHPNDWIAQHEGKVFRFGGIVTAAEELVTAKGFPFGRYTMEDYTGSYQFTLFGEEYKQYASLLKPNIYVIINSSIKQRGYYMKFFKPQPLEDAEYTFAVQQVSLVQDMQQHLQSVTLHIPVEKIQPTFIEELSDICANNVGETPLHLIVYDDTKQNLITFSASPVKITQEFYHWLQLQRMDATLDFTVQI
jgi:DNA polymerase-3 subunit alpha